MATDTVDHDKSVDKSPFSIRYPRAKFREAGHHGRKVLTLMSRSSTVAENCKAP
jgi:hypothetical protein